MTDAQQTFVVTYTYTADADSRDMWRPAHREWLGSRLEAGDLLTSGPLADGRGAVLIWRAAGETPLRAVLLHDPFARAGLIASTRVQEWTCVLGPWA